MFRLAVATTLLMASLPATAATSFTADFGGTAETASSFVYDISTHGQGQLKLTATSRKFTLPPGSLTTLAQTAAVGQVSRTVPGIGVAGGGSAPQIDTNSAGTAQAPLREALLISGDRRFSIHSLKLSFVDNNDTLKVYGVLDGNLIDLGYGSTINATPGNPGTIVGGLDGAALGRVPSTANNGTVTFGVAPTKLFSAYLFTTRIGGDVLFGGDRGQGYRLDSLTGALPEPGTWAMLILGFGVAGASLRRQRRALAA